MTINEAIEIIEVFAAKPSSDDVKEAMRMAIAALKAQQWIPCSERLPEACRSYLVTKEYEGGARVVEIDYKTDPEYGCEWIGVEEVMAWMEKPDPYMGDKGNGRVYCKNHM